MIRRMTGLVSLCVLISACGYGVEADRRLPAPGVLFDYQLGGDYALPEGAEAVVRQWDAQPDESAYSICYVNAFQTEAEADSPDGADAWPRGTVWQDAEDPDWPGEHPIDISTAHNRRSATDFVVRRFEECVDSGFDAVELDNLDTFTRYPQAPFDRNDTIAYARQLVDAAHRLGLSVAQKNTAELLDAASEIGFDFAIVESCGEFGECGEFAEVYGGRVYAIEYSPEGLSTACAQANGRFAVILRDQELTTPGQPGYAFSTC